MQVTVERIRKEAQGLTVAEQWVLMEKLVHQLKETSLPKRTFLDLNKLYGLGKGLWKEEDAQEYVDRLREERI